MLNHYNELILFRRIFRSWHSLFRTSVPVEIFYKLMWYVLKNFHVISLHQTKVFSKQTNPGNQAKFVEVDDAFHSAGSLQILPGGGLKNFPHPLSRGVKQIKRWLIGTIMLQINEVLNRVTNYKNIGWINCFCVISSDKLNFFISDVLILL